MKKLYPSKKAKRRAEYLERKKQRILLARQRNFKAETMGETLAIINGIRI